MVLEASCVGLLWGTHINISPVGASWLPDNICVLFFPAFLLCFLLGFGALSSKSAKMVHASSVAWLVRLLAAEGVSVFDVLSFSISTLGTRFVGRPFPYPYARTVVRNFIVTRTAHPLCDNLLLLL